MTQDTIGTIILFFANFWGNVVLFSIFLVGVYGIYTLYIKIVNSIFNTYD